MITGEGGFVSRTMPPVNWDCGPIPKACYDASLSLSQIRNLLLTVYLEPERVKRLAEDEKHLLWAEFSLEMLAEIDAETIYLFNQHQRDYREKGST